MSKSLTTPASRKPSSKPTSKATPAAELDTSDIWQALFALAEYTSDATEKADGNTLGGMVGNDLDAAAEALNAGKPVSLEILRADIVRLEAEDAEGEKPFAAGYGIAVLLRLILDCLKAAA
jgi:hypothetical protein